MRKWYIDNLRFLAVLLLFPYHTFMIYNTFESFYIHGAEIGVLSDVLMAVWPWIMPLLFTIAGMSSAYALKRRTGGEYVTERVHKLLLPLLFGMLLVVPIQTYLAELFHTGAGNYFHYFTQMKDLSGYAGGFTPGHLWFLLYLFIISLLALPVMLWHQKRGAKPVLPQITLPGLLALFILPLLMQAVLDISGKSVGEYFTFFLLGYFLLSQERVLGLLDRARIGLALAFATGFVLTFFWGMELYMFSPILGDVLSELYGWVGILALLGVAGRYWNTTTKVTEYLVKSSFGVYLFHQSWIVIVAYFVFRLTQSAALQIPLILLLSVPLTFLTYELAKRFSVTRFLFGLKK